MMRHGEDEMVLRRCGDEAWDGYCWRIKFAMVFTDFISASIASHFTLQMKHSSREVYGQRDSRSIRIAKAQRNNT